MKFSPNDFIHPYDKSAREHLETIPGFTAAQKAVLHMFNEEMVYGMNMAQKIRLGPRQLPEIYRLLPPVCDRLGIDEPEFYLEMNPQPNAYTFGDTRISITVNSGLLQLLSPDEVSAVLAHECGHILCRHVLYHSMAQMLLNMGEGIFGLVAALATPIKLGLFYWIRRSELSADRAAAVVMGSAKPVVDVMIRLAGGPRCLTENVNLELYMDQAKEYDLLQNSTWNKALQSLAIMYSDHPFPAVRSREVSQWCADEQFQRLMAAAGTHLESGQRCPTCGHAIETGWKFCSRCGDGQPLLSV